MADDAAHDTPGPGSDPLNAQFPLAAAGPEHGEVAAAQRSVRDDTSIAAGAPGVELVGRHTGVQAQLGERAASQVLVGAAAATSANGDGATSVTVRGGAEPPAEAGPAPAPVDDLPVWSFRERAEASEPGALTAAAPDANQAELAFTPSAQPGAPAEMAARPQPLFGPIGRPRSAVALALLAVVTLGVSALVWHHRVNRELEEFDPKLHARPGRSTAAVAIPWLAGLVVTLAGAVLIVGARLSIHVPLASHVTSLQADAMLAGLFAVPYLTLLLPFSLVGVVMTLERLRCVEEHVGTTTDRQVRAVGMSLLLVVPVIGGLVLIGVAQHRINAIWDAVAPAGRIVR